MSGGELGVSRVRALQPVSDHREDPHLGETASIAFSLHVKAPLGNQRAEVRLACKILNTMTDLGRPDSVKAE